MIDTRVALIGALVLVLLPTCAQGQKTTFRAGFARMSITPELPDTWTDANANSVYEPDHGDTFTDGNGNGNAVFDAYWRATPLPTATRSSTPTGVRPYGEIVSPGPETGPIIHAAVARLIEQARPGHSDLREALTFYASFDGKPDAAFALGDPRIYTAPSWDEWADGLPGIPEASAAAWMEGEGRFGDALRIDHVEDPILFFKADQNVAYQSENWSGTVSFWLRLDPDEDLIPNNFSDPIVITPKDWDDAALFVDFTRESPRHFRLAAFADTKVWNPSGEDWWELPDGTMPMITIADPPFGRDEWTHVVMTFDHFNTGRSDGVLTAYLNGDRVGDLTGREQTFTWDPAQALIKIGIQYAGYVDDLAFFNRALTDDEVKSLYELENGVASVLR